MIEWDIDKLLLCGVRARYHSEELEEARRIARDDVDWQKFLHQARLHNVAPLVYDTLRDESAILPPWVSEALRTSYYRVRSPALLSYYYMRMILDAVFDGFRALRPADRQ